MRVSAGEASVVVVGGFVQIHLDVRGSSKEQLTDVHCHTNNHVSNVFVEKASDKSVARCNHHVSLG